MTNKLKSPAIPVVAVPEKTVAAERTKPRVKAAHPPSSTMVVEAITSLKEKRGSSLQAIKKYIAATYLVDMEKQASFIKKYLKAAVDNETLIRTKGIGAAGSFKLNVTKAKGKAKPKTKSSDKPKAASPKAKKPTSPKKTVSAKTTKVVEKKTSKMAAKPPKAKSASAKPKVTKASPKKSKAPIGVKKTSPISNKTAAKRVAKK